MEKITTKSINARQSVRFSAPRARAASTGIAAALIGGAAFFAPAFSQAADYAYAQVNLVSDQPGIAARTDPNLLNPWGVAFSPTSPFWISDNHNNSATIYNAAGVPGSLVVSVSGGATGQIFNGSSIFNADRFIFASESGTIQGWRGALGTTAETLFDNSATGAIYKGLAVGGAAGTTTIYAANFGNGKIDVFNSTGQVSLPPSQFTDPSLPAKYEPFNIQNLDGKLYVSYAYKANPTDGDETPGAGLGYVSVYDTSGNLLHGGLVMTGGALNAPWGLAIAPSTFGNIGGDLLVGNFGDGVTNVYDPLTGAWIETLLGLDGKPLAIDGLWALTIGNGANVDNLYFTAGPNEENDGLFGQIEAVAVPEPGTLFAGASLAALCAGFWISRRKRGVAQV